MAGTYNRNLYNSALYNAGREDIGALGRSIIQAHTGPHVQAVIGSTAGVSLISDFIIQQGTVVKPPSSFKFPDLAARMRAVFPGVPPFTDRNPFLPASIRGFSFADLQARIFPSNKIPDLGGSIFGLFESTLAAIITGRLGEADLPASIFGTAKDLPAVMNLLLAGLPTPFAPSIGGRMLGIASPTLGARIHTPLDLAASLFGINAGDLPGTLNVLQFSDLRGRMLGLAAPQLSGFLRGFSPGTRDLPAKVSSYPSQLFATISPTFSGTTGFSTAFIATVSGGGFDFDLTPGNALLPTFIRSTVAEAATLSALIKTGGETNLLATIDFLGADNISASIGTIPFGERNREISAFLQPVRIHNLAAVMTINSNVSFLSASISALRDTGDLSAFIRVAETFVTAIMTVSTMSSSNLRALIGNPDCFGGSASSNLGATAVPQFVGDLGASLVSFIETNLKATINSDEIFHALDEISISFSPTRSRTSSLFQTCDQLLVTFSPFRGDNLGASISGIIPSVDIGASITATFPLLRVVPSISRITAADIRDLDALGLQEIRLQLEGNLTEFFYVSGTGQTFSKDASNNWKINIRSFRPIADNLFGEFASARICRLGALTSFATLDQAVRFCIQAVIGLTDQANLGASITGTGEIKDLTASIGISRYFHNMSGKLFPTSNPSSIAATVTAFSFNSVLNAFINPGGIEVEANLMASIAQQSVNNLAGDIIGQFTSPTVSGAGTLGLGAIMPGILRTSNITSSIDPSFKTDSLLLTGVHDEYVEGPSLEDIGWTPGSKLTVALWIKSNGTPVINESVIGNYTDIDNPTAGFGIRWVTVDDLEFFINGISNRARVSVDYPESWKFVVGVYDPTLGSDNIKFYSNHGALGSVKDDYTLPIGNETEPIFLGKTASIKTGIGEVVPSNSYFHELMIWDTALSQDEIRDLAGAPPSRIHRIPPTVDSGNYNSSSNLLLHWDMENLITTFPVIVPVAGPDDGSGTLINLTAADVSTTVSPSSPRANAAVEVTTSTYWSATTPAALPFVSGYTGSFTVWCLATFNSAGFSALWGMGNSSQGNTDDTLRLVKNNTGGPPLKLFINDNTLTNYIITGPTVLEDNSTWYSMIVTYDAGTRVAALYTNGSFSGSVTLSVDRQPQDEFTIAAAHPDQFGEIREHDGKLENYAFWDRVLTSTERGVLNDLTSEPILSEHATLVGNLVAWYRMGETHDGVILIDMAQSGGKNLVRSGPRATWISQTYAE